MKNLYVLMICLLMSQPTHANFPHSKQDEVTKTSVIRGIPFCVFILRDSVIKESDENKSRELHVLMEPENFSEVILTDLFRVLSERFPTPQSMQVLVYSDIEQLRKLVIGIGQSGDESAIKKHQSAYYTRTKQVELFRYNPNFPELGMKTVILRGKE